MTRPYNIENLPEYDRNYYPDNYSHTVDLCGLTPSHWWCADILGLVRQAAERLTSGQYGLFVTRDSSGTGAKTGYRFGADDQVVVQEIADLYERARRRAESPS